MTIIERPVTATAPTEVEAERKPEPKPWRLIIRSALGGITLALLWWSNFGDGTVGEGLTTQVFGEEAEEVAMGSGLTAAAFASSPASPAR